MHKKLIPFLFSETANHGHMMNNLDASAATLESCPLGNKQSGKTEFVLLWACLLACVVAFGAGCRNRVTRSDSASELRLLESECGVVWPTNRVDGEGASITSLRNIRRLARIEVTEEEFTRWRPLMDSKIGEWMEVPSATKDEALSKVCPWWSPRDYGEGPVIKFISEREVGRSNRWMLTVTAVRSNSDRILFIDALLPKE